MLAEWRNRARRDRLVAVNVPSPEPFAFYIVHPAPRQSPVSPTAPQFLQTRMRESTRHMAFWPRTHCHCERSEAISWPMGIASSPRSSQWWRDFDDRRSCLHFGGGAGAADCGAEGVAGRG